MKERRAWICISLLTAVSMRDVWEVSQRREHSYKFVEKATVAQASKSAGKRIRLKTRKWFIFIPLMRKPLLINLQWYLHLFQYEPNYTRLRTIRCFGNNTKYEIAV